MLRSIIEPNIFGSAPGSQDPFLTLSSTYFCTIFLHPLHQLPQGCWQGCVHPEPNSFSPRGSEYRREKFRGKNRKHAMKFIKSFRFSFNFLLFLNYLFGYFFYKICKVRSGSDWQSSWIRIRKKMNADPQPWLLNSLTMSSTRIWERLRSSELETELYCRISSSSTNMEVVLEQKLTCTQQQQQQDLNQSEACLADKNIKVSKNKTSSKR